MTDLESAFITLRRLSGHFSVVRLPPDAPVPMELLAPRADMEIVSVTRTATELSIVTSVDGVPASGREEGPWSAWYVVGPIAFGMTGVVSSLVAPLADVQCPVFVLSTFDSDLLLVPSDSIDKADEALTAAGHRIVG